MKSLRSRLVRWLGGLPTILVGGLWLILCQAWPSRVPESHAAPPAAVTRVHFPQHAPQESGGSLMPLAFVRSTGAGEELPAADTPDSVRLLLGAGNGHLLERGAPAPDAFAPAIRPAVPLENQAVFRLADPPERAFRSRSPAQREVAVEVAPPLREGGFNLPALDPDELGNTNSAWQVSFLVECDERGAVEAVYVESGTTNAAFNLALARRITREGAAAPGERRRGRLVISYGEE